jgi:two-component system, OmpR family, sensor kinase
MNRLGLRSRLLVVVVAAVAVALAGLLVGFNLLLARNLSHDANNLVRQRASAELSVLRPAGNRVVLAEAPDDVAPDSSVWVFSRGRTLEFPRTDRRIDAAARKLAGGPLGFVDIPSPHTRLYSTPVVVQGRRLGTVVAAGSLSAYEQTRKTALIGSLIFGGVLLLLVAVAARWLVASALRPVARMTRQAAAWGERNLEHRFGLGEPRDELTELAATLDQLLDRLAASLRHEQRFSAEISHELRTPLSRVLAETELALRRERSPGEYRAALELVHQNAEQLTRTVDALVAAARHEVKTHHGTADAFDAAAGAVDACAGLAREREVEVTLERKSRPIRLGVEADFAERILQPIVENACWYGQNRVRLSVERAGAAVVYSIDDDGPGVGESERERIFEAGVRGRLAKGNGAGGAGLGLALARRLARSASGDIEAVAANEGGHFVVRLPAA